MPFVATWVDLEITILNEVSQTKTNIMYHLYVESKKKKIQKEIDLYTKQKQTHRQRKQTYGYQRRKGGREIN